MADKQIAPTSCGNCGSALALSTGPGRIRSYLGGAGYEIPADLEYPVCPNCGAEWLTATQIKRLSDAIERERQQRNRSPV